MTTDTQTNLFDRIHTHTKWVQQDEQLIKQLFKAQNIEQKIQALTPKSEPYLQNIFQTSTPEYTAFVEEITQLILEQNQSIIAEISLENQGIKAIESSRIQQRIKQKKSKPPLKKPPTTTKTLLQLQKFSELTTRSQRKKFLRKLPKNEKKKILKLTRKTRK